MSKTIQQLQKTDKKIKDIKPSVCMCKASSRGKKHPIKTDKCPCDNCKCVT